MLAGWGMEYRRRRLFVQADAGPLREFYRQPFASRGDDCRALGFVALDLETTGLDPRLDAILSIGLVEIHRQRIELSSARHHLLSPDRPIPERSAIIHRITDDQAAGGERLDLALPPLLAQLAGKVLVAHHARIETQFLDRACQQLYGAGFLTPVIDTQRIARRSLERSNQAFGPQALRLAECRQRHGLPRYRPHNALSDALACAELFLVQLSQYDDSKPIALKSFL